MSRLFLGPRAGERGGGFALFAVGRGLHRGLAAGVDGRQVGAFCDQALGQRPGGVPCRQVQCGGAAAGAGVDVGFVGQQRPDTSRLDAIRGVLRLAAPVDPPR